MFCSDEREAGLDPSETNRLGPIGSTTAAVTFYAAVQEAVRRLQKAVSTFGQTERETARGGHSTVQEPST